MGVNDFAIERVWGLQVLDSRGNPTVKAYVKLAGGSLGWGIAPSGASRGEREAVELRDGGGKWRGKGVSRAVSLLNTVVAPRLEGVDARRQAQIDRLLIELDGTPNKSRLGGNTTTALSIAVSRAAAAQARLELFQYLGGAGARRLPIPLLNVINGGVHAGNELDFQEFMIIPYGFESFTEAMRAAVETYGELKSLLKDRYGASAVNVGDEGGFAPPMRSAEEALKTLVDAVEKAGYQPGSEIALGIDAAASQLYSNGRYSVEGKSLSREELLSLYQRLVEQYPIVYLEDPFSEDDYEGFKAAVDALSTETIIVGDDLLVTNPQRVKEASALKAVTGLLVKVNQVGTLTEALEAIQAARDRGIVHIVSHRSGDTEDTFIADLAVATEALMIKTGAPARGERTSKYNRLLEIENILGYSAEYAGPELRGVMGRR
ncbi:enolase [Aeropyrum pernix K1]|uniref:Enolase n=1 Tax=Aeropyrum pernix (strain ATCC 700893 / DSM 11879 / JCM 9820 / NBRC 100138 / K1) TaxID=272557 RepID=ENO_AERPE|nr:phosphopyruvate hydratase [Aeropyrum pernix]Q9Y927.1 RecName: Full=Enolase; AltName: Full=2-phospho-D-glycerate hydro-lyase; AltName: Full=2-phosphoglycerate dehydratase [Aeropyrum pernix K1]BAA81473.1 enolase [Aeropyrum pernix K1]